MIPFAFIVFTLMVSPGGGGTPLFGLCGYVLLNRVWFSRSWVLNRVYDFTIKHFEQVVLLDWKPFKECEDLRWAAYICNTDNFSVKITWFRMQNKANQGQKVVSPALNRVAKWEVFVLNRVGVCGPLAAHLYPNFPWVPPLGVSAV